MRPRSTACRRPRRSSGAAACRSSSARTTSAGSSPLSCVLSACSPTATATPRSSGCARRSRARRGCSRTTASSRMHRPTVVEAEREKLERYRRELAAARRLSVTAVEWLDAMSPWPRDGFGLDRMRALARRARRSAGGLPGDPRRRDERQVDRDGHDRAAPALRGALGRLDDLAARRELERADPTRRGGGGLRGGGRPRQRGRRAPRSDAVRDRHRGCAHGVRRRGGRRRGRRGRTRRPPRRDERPPDAGRAPHQRRARAHGRTRRDARSRSRRRSSRSRRSSAIVVLSDHTYAHLVPERATRDRRSARRRGGVRRTSRSRPSRTSRCPVASSAATGRSETARTIPTVRATWWSRLDGDDYTIVRVDPRRQGRRRDAPALCAARVALRRHRRPRRPVLSRPTSSPSVRARHFEHVEVVDDPVAAVARAHELGEPVLVTGSLYLLGDLAQAEHRSAWRG